MHLIIPDKIPFREYDLRLTFHSPYPLYAIAIQWLERSRGSLCAAGFPLDFGSGLLNLFDKAGLTMAVVVLKPLPESVHAIN